MKYTAAFKASMVKKMTGRAAVSANALSREFGVSQASLSKWRREASTVLVVSTNKPPQTELAPKKRVQDWTAEEKMRALQDTAGMNEMELGGYLRRTGLYSEQLDEWRKEAVAALGGGSAKGKRSSEQRRIQALERELRRKDKALAEATALLVLKKKFDSLFEAEEDDTSPESDV